MAQHTAQQAAGASIAAQSGVSSADLQHMHVPWLAMVSAGCFVLAALLMLVRRVIQRIYRCCSSARDVELGGGRDGTYTWSDLGGGGPRYERTSCADTDGTWSDIGLGRTDGTEVLKGGDRLTNPDVNVEPVDEEEDRSGAKAIATAMASLTESLTTRNFELAYGEPIEMDPDSPLSLPRPPQDHELSDDEWFVQLSAAPHNIDPSVVAGGREYL